MQKIDKKIYMRSSHSNFKPQTLNLLTLIMVLLCARAPAQNVELLRDSSLEGFVKLNGTAAYRAERGEMGWEIVGAATLNTPNTFLATKKTYRDFILDLDVWVDPRLNSGIQIRSESRPDYQNGRVHGYQVEIDPSARAWSGGIYDESRRGWLYPLTRNEAARKAFQKGQWNHYHIEAVGHSIRSWVNGVQCSDLYDDRTREGFIALQVHSIADSALAGATVRWRNIRIQTEDIDAHVWPPQEGVATVNLVPGKLTAAEKAAGWRFLNKKNANAGTWPIAFQSYELQFDFLLPRAGKCSAAVSPLPIAAEMETDSAGARLRTYLSAGGARTEGVVAAFRGAGDWNQGRLLVAENRVEWWINEQKAAVLPLGAEHAGQTLLVQTRGAGAFFRNIKIKPLP